jgi:hypothetical protein
MAKHWRDQFKDNSAARAAEEEKRVANSEGWESGSDPGPNARSSRRSIQLGVRSSSPSRPQFERSGGKAGINMRVGGGVPFEKERKQPETPPETAPAAEERSALEQPTPPTAEQKAPQKQGLLSKLSSLFDKGEG